MAKLTYNPENDRFENKTISVPANIFVTVTKGAAVNFYNEEKNEYKNTGKSLAKVFEIEINEEQWYGFRKE